MTANRLLGCGATANQYDEITVGTGLSLLNSNLTATAVGSSQWTTSGSDIYYNTGKVSIAKTTPFSTAFRTVGGYL